MNDEDEPFGRWDLDEFLNSMPPAARRNHDRHMRVWRIQMRLFRLLRWPSWPVLNVVWVFWTALMEEGWQAIKPRWGALTFSYLNDGMRPTLYHTFMSVLRPNDTMLYPKGAPRNRNEA
jgi:hypothetical protein